MAVELLIRNFDGVGSRRKGDIVAVKAIPHKGWGKKEGPPNYTIVRIDDVDITTIKAFYFSRHKPTAFALSPINELYATETVKSTYRIDVDSLAEAEKTIITKGELLPLAFNEFEAKIIDRVVELEVIK